MSELPHHCQKRACNNRADEFPLIFHVAEGFDRDNCPEAYMLVPLLHCIDCQQIFDPKLFAVPLVQGAIAAGVMPPDLETLRVEWRKTGSLEWQAYITATAASQGGGTA